MTVNGKKVIDWVEKELPPLSWGVISMKVMKKFLEEGISPRKIEESTLFSAELVEEIKKTISATYQKELPKM